MFRQKMMSEEYNTTNKNRFQLKLILLASIKVVNLNWCHLKLTRTIYLDDSLKSFALRQTWIQLYLKFGKYYYCSRQFLLIYEYFHNFSLTEINYFSPKLFVKKSEPFKKFVEHMHHHPISG